MSMIFDQGEFIELDFNPSTGHEPMKRRPALVVSCSRFNAFLSSLTVVCPITSTDNGHPLHIPLGAADDVSGFVCVEQLRSVNLASRRAKSIEAFISEDTMAEVLEAIGAVFNI